MNQNLNDLFITLDFGYFLGRLDLIEKHDEEWCKIQNIYRGLKLRSYKDLETNTTIMEEEHGN